MSLHPAEASRDDAFRYYDQLDWYSSAGPLLETRYRSAVLAGLILSIGGQASSIVGLPALIISRISVG